LESGIVIPISIPTLFWKKGIIGWVIGAKIGDYF
jgi:hypothetical protein